VKGQTTAGGNQKRVPGGKIKKMEVTTENGSDNGKCWGDKGVSAYHASLFYRKDDRAMRHCALYNMSALKISGLPDYTPTATFPNFFMGFCCDRLYEHA